MDMIESVAALAALAQQTRLETFRLLVAHEPDGVAAGELARMLAVPQNTLSAHLSVMANVGLITGERHGRSIRYRAHLGRFRELVVYLTQDCCGGRPEVCAPLVADLVNCQRQEGRCA